MRVVFGFSSVCLAIANLDFSRVHLVDVQGSNLLFRSNMPVNDTDFAVDDLFEMMRKRAAESNVQFPKSFFFSDVTLNNVADYDKREMDFWKSAPASFGELVKWPLGFQGIVSPHDLSDSVRKATCKAGITEIDSLDKKAHELWEMMQSPNATVILVHCTAGCDRTGEMVAAYRVVNGDFLSGRPSASDPRNISQIYAEDVSECGRPPNYFSTTALKWYCFCESYKGMEFVGNPKVASEPPTCLHFASCKTFGDCNPVTSGSELLV